MRYVFGSRRRKDAQTLVFFILAFGTIILLCGLAIDSGLLFLAKAKMGRAVDGAALAAVGNFHRSDVPTTNRDDVATIMRNFAVANYTDLGTISTTGGPSGGTASTSGTTTTYTYNFNDGTQDTNLQYKRFVQVTLTTGSGGGITSATCNARCPVHTYFIGYAGNYFRDLKVSSSAVATRNPRLIMIVVDRSASMLQPGGGAYGLPQAVVQFLDFFDTSSDYIGIVSFGTSARLEMPLTTNFIQAGTNVLFNAYQTDANETGINSQGASYSPVGIPGADPEEFTSNADYDSGYDITGVRRLKFGGQTAADDGIRLGMEQLMANAGFNDPDVVKYLVLFTDGKWNEMRTLVAAPGYTNVVNGPPAASSTVKYVTNTAGWSTTIANDTNIVPVPTMSPLPYVTNAIAAANPYDYTPLAANHLTDQWQSSDGINEPLGAAAQLEGAPMTFTTNTWVASSGATNFYTHNIDVWLQPGSVDYEYHVAGGHPTTPAIHVSNFNDPTQHIAISLNTGDSNVLVVPGYVADGLVFDGLDLSYPDNLAYGGSTYPKFRNDNFQQPFMWPDDTTSVATAADINNYTTATSLEREFMFRNYPNLLTGFYVNRPDEPLSTATEPLDNSKRNLYGLGAYYPSAGFYWPFDLVGLDEDATYGLTNATIDPDVTHTGLARHATYSINMLSAAAAPEWSGEWFYKSVAGDGTGDVSGVGTTSASTLMATKSDWQAGAPSWLTADFDVSDEDIMTNESAHNTNLAVSVWRPATFQGTTVSLGSISRSDPSNYTGGYVTDGAGNYFRNSMAWSGRPTHYFDFSQSKWVRVADNHNEDTQMLPIGNWKAQEYAWHARNMNVTIYTVGYGQLVSPDEQVLLAEIANSTNTTAGNVQTFNGNSVTGYVPGPGTAITFNPSQPIGQQFYATNSTDISNDFFQVGQAINAALTQ